MGTVFRGVHAETGEAVAIKVLKVADEEFIERFRREIAMSTSIVHPNVCRVLAHGEPAEGPPYFVMELLQGQTLYDMIGRGQMSVSAASGAMEQILRGLDAIHQHGIVHRDLKPGNIFIVQDGTLRILDFGIARQVKAASLTRAGQRIGTSFYQAPEQIGASRGVDARADIFSCGVIMYEMVCGCLPFGKCEPKDVLRKLFSNQLLPATRFRDDLPPALVAWIDRAMAVQPMDRFQSAADALAALEAV